MNLSEEVLRAVDQMSGESKIVQLLSKLLYVVI